MLSSRSLLIDYLFLIVVCVCVCVCVCSISTQSGSALAVLLNLHSPEPQISSSSLSSKALGSALFLLAFPVAFDRFPLEVILFWGVILPKNTYNKIMISTIGTSTFHPTFLVGTGQQEELVADKGHGAAMSSRSVLWDSCEPDLSD